MVQDGFEMLYESPLVKRIGNTPIIDLSDIFPNNINVIGKLEERNLGGSIKARAAIALLRDAHSKGLLKPNSIIIESSSGNLGLALAEICRELKIKFICVVDTRTNIETIRLLNTLGAKVVIVSEPDTEGMSLLETRIKRVKDLLSSTPNSIWLNQYENQANPQAHEGTMNEFLTQLQKKPDYFACAISTCGTLKGCSAVLRKSAQQTQIIAVDAEGSSIFAHSKKERRLPGYGAGFRPPFFDINLADIHLQVSDLDTIKACHLVLQKKGILVGGSSGAVIAALLAIAKELPSRSTCAIILPDGGERYYDTIYSSEWIGRTFEKKALHDLEKNQCGYTVNSVTLEVETSSHI